MNPKDLAGMRKVGMHYIPNAVLLQLSLAMKEGAGKYGAHNWREHKIQASEYYDALQRHIMEWWEGADLDKDSDLPNLIKALACLVILQDALDNNMLIDDRPKNTYPDNWLKMLNKKAADLVDRLPWDKPAYTRYTISENRPEKEQSGYSTGGTKKTWVDRFDQEMVEMFHAAKTTDPLPSPLPHNHSHTFSGQGCIDPKQHGSESDPVIEALSSSAGRLPGV